MKQILGLCLMLMLAFGCKSSQKISQKDLPEDFSLEIRRSPCMGTCPYFSLQLTADGMVTYTGKAHVANIGRFQKQISAEKRVQIRQELQQSGFWEWPTEYDNGGLLDAPTTVLAATENGKTHRLSIMVARPEGFFTLVKKLENLIGEDGYQKAQN
ncbi:MAG: DUF6438 domain-containing protein [Bacteroidota bacterium]